MRRLVMLGIAGVWLATLTAAWAAEPDRSRFDRRREGELKVGDAAPDFLVQDVQGKTTVRLSELRGGPVVLLFGSCT